MVCRGVSIALRVSCVIITSICLGLSGSGCGVKVVGPADEETIRAQQEVFNQYHAVKNDPVLKELGVPKNIIQSRTTSYPITRQWNDDGFKMMSVAVSLQAFQFLFAVVLITIVAMEENPSKFFVMTLILAGLCVIMGFIAMVINFYAGVNFRKIMLEGSLSIYKEAEDRLSEDEFKHLKAKMIHVVRSQIKTAEANVKAYGEADYSVIVIGWIASGAVGIVAIIILVADMVVSVLRHNEEIEY